jgi:hypothetical protein
MLGSGRMRRFGAYLGVVVAAVASIATSSPEWSLDDSAEDIATRLDTNVPEEVRHFTVRSSEQHDARVTGTIAWDESQPEPQAAVLVRIESDDGEATESIHRAPDDSGFELSLSPPCAGEGCEHGYTVTLKLVDGWPNEHVDVTWSLSGHIGGEGMEEPDGAFITVSED